MTFDEFNDQVTGGADENGPGLRRVFDHLIATGVDVAAVLAGTIGTTLGERVRGLRRGKHWTIDELVARSGVSKGSLSHIENNQQQPGIKVVVKLAKALDVNIDNLLQGALGIAYQRDAASPPKSPDLTPLRELVQRWRTEWVSADPVTVIREAADDLTAALDAIEKGAL